jgi:hypothetical protein
MKGHAGGYFGPRASQLATQLIVAAHFAATLFTLLPARHRFKQGRAAEKRGTIS